MAGLQVGNNILKNAMILVQYEVTPAKFAQIMVHLFVLVNAA